MSTQPVAKKIKLKASSQKKSEDYKSNPNREIVFKEPEPKKRSVSITPQAELSYDKYVGGDKGGVQVSASKSIPTGRSNISIGGRYKGASGSASYSPTDKTIDIEGGLETKKGGRFAASKFGNRYSGSYTSPSGKSISIGSDKDVSIAYPTKKGGFVSVSASPQGASGSYTTKKGNTYTADYGKEKKSFSVGARFNIKKKK